MKNFLKRTPPHRILGWVLILILLVTMPVSADVGDNLNGWLINFLGYGKEGSTPNDYGGSLVERVNYLEKQQQAICSKTDSLATKEQIKNLATKEDVENVSKAANASYNLYVYIPKNVATGNYDGQRVTITSSSGSQNATATLRDDGVNYSATLYFNFNGNCRLNFTILCNSAVYGVQVPVAISATGQEQILWNKGYYSDQYSWDFIHQICSNNLTNRFFDAGNVLRGGWYITNIQNSFLQIWRKTDLGRKDWEGANSVASNYWQTFNAENGTNVAYSSGALSYNELWSGWLCSNRGTGFDYWTATVEGGNNSYFVDDDSVIRVHYNAYDHCCCPAVWIH